MAAASPPGEAARLALLESHAILDTAPEPQFDEVVRLASEICEAPIALMTLVDRDRQWFKSAVGLDLLETPRSVAFCAHTILQDEIFVVPDAKSDPRFATNPLVSGNPHIRFYAGAPLAGESGNHLGALCVIDRIPRKLTPFQERALRTLGDQIQAQLELRVRIRELDERRDAMRVLQRQRSDLRAFLLHDLKNALGSILPNAEYLLDHATLSDDERDAGAEIAASSERMLGMLNELVDVDRTRDARLRLDRAPVDVAELAGAVERRFRYRCEVAKQRLELDVSPEIVIYADADLLERVLENLLGNALKYGCSEDGTLRIGARSSTGGDVLLSVTDEGPGVPEEDRARIFENFEQLDRDRAAAHRASWGVGLAFCRAAVEAHGGTIWVEDHAPHGAAFRVRLPAMSSLPPRSK